MHNDTSKHKYFRTWQLITGTEKWKISQSRDIRSMSKTKKNAISFIFTHNVLIKYQRFTTSSVIYKAQWKIPLRFIYFIFH